MEDNRKSPILWKFNILTAINQYTYKKDTKNKAKRLKTTTFGIAK